jgi:hypothetical protein
MIIDQDEFASAASSTRIETVEAFDGEGQTEVSENLQGSFIDCLCECVKRLLKGRVPLKQKQLKSLRQYKRLLRKVASKKTSQGERRRILQTGGFVGAVLPALLGGLSSILGPVVGRLVSRNGKH